MKKKYLLALAFLGAFFCIYTETIYFSGDSLVAKTSENSEYTSLDGNAEVKPTTLKYRQTLSKFLEKFSFYHRKWASF